MKTLWFKATYVADILCGSKTDTIRKASKRLPDVGDRVAFSVGPRDPFAFARVVLVEPVQDIDPHRATALASIYDDHMRADYVRIEFVLEART